jgi:hypothetical protein
MTTPPFIRLDSNRLPEVGPSLLPFPAPAGLEPEVVTWVNTGGFSGTASFSGTSTSQFGSLVHYSFTAGNLSAAPGLNTATLSLPMDRLSGPFVRTQDAYGSLAAVTDSNQLLTGSVQALVGGTLFLITLDNATGVTQGMSTFGLQGMAAYHLL